LFEIVTKVVIHKYTLPGRYTQPLNN